MKRLEPWPRTYARDGVHGLSLDRQLEMLAGIETRSRYIDRLTIRQLTRRDPASLKQRKELLRPTSRRTPERIYVASFRVLGWTIPDICRVIAAAGRRNASVYALDVDREISVAMPGPELLEAIAVLYEERITADREGVRYAGVEASKEARRNRRAAKLTKARELWGRPPGEISAADIARQVGLSVRTLHTYLGPRYAAQQRREAP